MATQTVGTDPTPFVFAHDVSSAVTEKECEELARLATEGVCLEMGSLYGRSTIALASTAKKVHAVDWHLGDEHAGYTRTAEEFLDNLYRYQVREQVVVHIGRFEDVLPVFGTGIFDLVFIDGAHDEEDVHRDYRLAHRVVRAGGRICFHDYGHPTFGVTQAVDTIRGTRPFHKVQSLAVLRV